MDKHTALLIALGIVLHLIGYCVGYMGRRFDDEMQQLRGETRDI